MLENWVKMVEPFPELNVEVATDREKLFDLADALLASINKDSNVRDMPRDIRDLAKLIGELCDKYLPDQKWPLVGGLILLRLYCPTLVSPASYGLLRPDYVMSSGFRKNLTQITRLLQNTSNHQPFKGELVSFLKFSLDKEKQQTAPMWC